MDRERNVLDLPTPRKAPCVNIGKAVIAPSDDNPAPNAISKNRVIPDVLIPSDSDMHNPLIKLSMKNISTV